MASSASVSSEYNLAGALIFTVYVVSALFFTGVIIAMLLYSPQSAHGSSSSSSPKTRDRLSHGKRLQIFASLSVLSFAILSYHMMDFLIVSYKAWALERDTEVPQRLFGHDGLIDLRQGITRVYIWQWLTSSTLFQDFAEIICGSSARYWWTQQALLTTMIWVFFMSIEGAS